MPESSATLNGFVTQRISFRGALAGDGGEGEVFLSVGALTAGSVEGEASTTGETARGLQAARKGIATAKRKKGIAGRNLTKALFRQHPRFSKEIRPMAQ